MPLVYARLLMFCSSLRPFFGERIRARNSALRIFCVRWNFSRNCAGLSLVYVDAPTIILSPVFEQAGHV
jgi:hypothetical protein